MIAAMDMERPQFQAMLSTLRQGDIVNVHELSRLGRSTKDLLTIVERVMDEGCIIKFHKENLAFSSCEKQDALQMLTLSMLSAIAEFEMNLLLGRHRNCKNKGAL